MTQKYTPGLWTVNLIRNISSFSVLDTAGRVIACVGFKSRSREDAKANSHLITAAPDLLTALELAYSKCENAINDMEGESYLSEDDKAIIKAAIAKARGQS